MSRESIQDEKLDFEMVAAIALEITDRYKLLVKLIPEKYNPILKHLAASSIHMTFFMADLNEKINGDKIGLPKELMEKFHVDCGCHFNEDKK